MYFEYQYDKDSRITHVLRETGDHIYLEYDDASRLTNETWKDSAFTEIYAFEWDYDLAGNRTYENNRGAQTYFTFDADNAVTLSHNLSEGHSYFTYDSRGNCTIIEEPSGSTYFEFNNANLVTSIKYPSGVSNYFHYDSMLRRYAMEDSDGLRYFSWDYSGLKLLTERDDQGEVTALYSHGYSAIPGIGSVTNVQKFENDTVFDQTTACDHRGSVYRLTNDDGDVVFSAEYNAFGEVLDESNTGATNRLGYQSNWLTLKDSGNELVISPARVYSAKLGRFLQKDFLFQMTLLRQQGSYRNSIFRGRQRSLFSVDNFGLYEAFSGNSYSYSDAMGLTTWILNGIKVELENPSEQFVNQVKINSSLHPDLHNFAVRARIIWATKKAFEAIEGMSDFLDNQLPNLSVSGISSAMKEPTIRNQFKQRYQDLWQKIKKSEIKIKFGGIVCDDDPDCNFYTLGEPNKPLDRTIGICSRAVNNEIDKLAAAIVHELLHIFFGLEDPREYASDGSNGQSVIFEPSKNTIYEIDADGNRFLLEQAGSYRFDQNGVPFASPLDDPEAYEIYTYQYLQNNK